MIVLMTIFWMAWAAIFYTYVLFPILLAGCARFWEKKSPRWREEEAEKLPRITMVIAAFNEGDVLEAKLENTWKIDYPSELFEVYIGSDGSSDATAEILAREKDPRLHAFPFPERRGKISVLNDLVNRVNTNIIVMSDASTMFAPDAVKKLVRHFEDPHVGCVTGELSLEQEGGASGEGFYLRYERLLKRSEGRLGCVIGCVGAIFAIRKDLYTPLPATTIVEDFVLCMRVLEQGFWARSEPGAQAVDPASASSRSEMARKIRIGAGGFQALGLTRPLLHPRFGMCAFAFWGHKVLRWLVPMFFLAGLASNIGLVHSSFFRALLILQIAGALIAYWAYKVGPKKPTPKWTKPISYFYLMNYALFCGFLRFLFRTQRVTWDRG